MTSRTKSASRWLLVPEGVDGQGRLQGALVLTCARFVAGATSGQESTGRFKYRCDR